MVTAQSTASPIDYQYDGIYAPSEVSGYLLATMPAEQQPPTSRRILRWIRRGLVAPEQRAAAGRGVVINFDDLVTCQAITLMRKAGLRLGAIGQAERYFSKLYRLDRPFAYREFWYSGQDVVGAWDGLLISGSRGGQIAWDFLRQWLTPLSLHLRFAETNGRPESWEPVDGVSLRPAIQLGQPCLAGTRIPTRAIWSYVAAGDSVEYVAASYGLTVADVERAVAWEERVRAALDAQAAVSA